MLIVELMNSFQKQDYGVLQFGFFSPVGYTADVNCQKEAKNLSVTKITEAVYSSREVRQKMSKSILVFKYNQHPIWHRHGSSHY